MSRKPQPGCSENHNLDVQQQLSSDVRQHQNLAVQYFIVDVWKHLYSYLTPSQSGFNITVRMSENAWILISNSTTTWMMPAPQPRFQITPPSFQHGCTTHQPTVCPTEFPATLQLGCLTTPQSGWQENTTSYPVRHFLSWDVRQHLNLDIGEHLKLATWHQFNWTSDDDIIWMSSDNITRLSDTSLNQNPKLPPHGWPTVLQLQWQTTPGC